MSISQNFPAVSPTLNLNFARSKKLDPRITFTRSSSATRTNAQGLVETVSANIPRFEHSYNSSTGSVNSLGLLIEESRTNLTTYSEQFNDASWTKNNAGITTNTSATTAPDGSNNAEKLIESLDVSTTYHTINKSGGFSATSGTSYTYSLFVKAAERTKCIIGFDIGSAFSNYQYGLYDLSAGTSSIHLGSPTISITPYPNGWYRCSVTAAATGTATATYTLQTYTTSNGYVGDGTSGIYIWGAQLETGAFPTSYIPTVASTVTRSADNASITGTNFSSWYNQSEGTLYASIRNQTVRSSLTYDRFVALCGSNPNTDGIAIYTQTSPGGGLFGGLLFAITSGGTESVDFNVGGPQNVGRAILAYKSNDAAGTVNGLTPVTDTSVILPTCVELRIFGSSRFQPAPTGTISQLTYYPRRLTNTQLQNLTK